MHEANDNNKLNLARFLIICSYDSLAAYCRCQLIEMTRYILIGVSFLSQVISFHVNHPTWKESLLTYFYEKCAAVVYQFDLRQLKDEVLVILYVESLIWALFFLSSLNLRK